MERFDFINKLAKIAGVSSKESRLFAEIFIRKIYSLIQPGDGIKLEGIGTAHYARLKFNPETTGNHDTHSDVLVFTDTEQDSSATVFTIPQPEELKINPLDKFFNLSFGKPVISSTAASQKFLPVNEDEIESLLNSKAEKLIAGHTIIKTFVDPGLVIRSSEPKIPESKVDTEDAFLDEDLDSLLLSDIKDEELLKELESIKWDLDDESSGEEIEKLPLPEIPANNESSDIGIENSSQTISEELSHPEINENDSDEILSADHSEELINQTNEILPEEKFETENMSSSKTASEFEQVKSFRSELSNKISDEENKIDPFQAAIEKVTRELEQEDKFSEEVFQQEYDSELNDEFIEVKPKSSVIDSKIITVINPGEEKEVDQSEDPEEKNIDPEKYHRDALKEAANYVNKKRTFGAEKEKKQSRISLLIIILVLLLLTASIYIYLKFIKNPEHDFRGGTGGGNISNTSLVEVVERNYELPVSYPYPNSQRNSFVHFDGLDNSLFIISTDVVPKDSAVTESQVATEKDVVPPVKINETGKTEIVRVKENIYRSGNDFIVQVGSFKSKTIADNEGLKYNRQGKLAYIEEVEIPGRGTWFRLRIGNFKTIEDAEVFSNKSN